jgi:hypothetical protein
VKKLKLVAYKFDRPNGYDPYNSDEIATIRVIMQWVDA